MNNKFFALAIAAGLLTGTAVSASAAVTSDSQGNTTTQQVTPMPPPAGSTAQNTSNMAPGYTGGPVDTGTRPATLTPHVDRGNAEGGNGGGK